MLKRWLRSVCKLSARCLFAFLWAERVEALQGSSLSFPHLCLVRAWRFRPGHVFDSFAGLNVTDAMMFDMIFNTPYQKISVFYSLLIIRLTVCWTQRLNLALHDAFVSTAIARERRRGFCRRKSGNSSFWTRCCHLTNPASETASKTTRVNRPLLRRVSILPRSSVQKDDALSVSIL